MADFLKYAEAAKALGIPENERLAWCEAKIDKDRGRDERAFEREEEKRRLEDEKEKRRLEDEKEKRRLEDEKEKRRLEDEKEKRRLEERRLDQEHELKLRELEVDVKRSQQPHEKSSSNKCITRPKIPVYNEKVDLIESYIHRFELHAHSVSWNKDDWAPCLANLLTGQALEVFLSLDVEQAKDYDILKKALFRRFQCTQEGFCLKYKACKPEGTENFSTFVNRLKQYLNRWLELAGVSNREHNADYEALYDVFLMDQIYTVCHNDLVVHLKERKPRTSAELTAIAEQYASAHPSKNLSKPKGNEPYFSASFAQDQHETRRLPFKQGAYRRNHSEGGDRNKNNDNSNFKKVVYPQHNKQQASTKEGNIGAHKRYKPAGASFTCYRCGKPNHLARDCKSKNPLVFQGNTCTAAAESNIAQGLEVGTLKLCQGLVNGRQCRTLRDTGSTLVAVNDAYIDENDLTGFGMNVRNVTGKIDKLKTARVKIDTPFLVGEVVAAVIDNPAFDLIIGNLPDVKECTEEEIKAWEAQHKIQDSNAVTRQQAKKVQGKLTTITATFDSDPVQFKKEQSTDESLQPYFRKAQGKQEGRIKFVMEDGLLYRHYEGRTETSKQLMIPKRYRTEILKLGHDTPTAAHQGVRRTKLRIQAEFFWPNMFAEINRHVKTCDICQKRTPKGRCTRAPLQDTPMITQPFERIAIDLIGPLEKSDRGNRFILTVTDYATRWAEGIPMKEIGTEQIAEALMSIFARVGIAKEILSDQGPQFISDLMKETMRLMGVKQIFSSPYHPQCNGLCERLNGTIKSMLQKVAATNPTDWDRYLPAVLFAYREVAQESTGYSPFELLYGRSPRGPMAVIKDLFTSTNIEPEVKSNYQYVVDLERRIRETCEIAQHAVKEKSEQSKEYYNQGTKMRTLKKKDRVLVLLPKKKNRLVLSWKGPFKVVGKTSKVNYQICMKGKVKTFHINAIKKYEDMKQTITRTFYLG